MAEDAGSAVRSDAVLVCSVGSLTVFDAALFSWLQPGRDKSVVDVGLIRYPHRTALEVSPWLGFADSDCCCCLRPGGVLER